MHPLVRDLYKRFMMVGRDYPLGLDYVRSKVKSSFHRQSNLTNEEDILRAVHIGRHMVKEMMAVIQLKKYRTMKNRYDTQQEDLSQLTHKEETDEITSIPPHTST